MAPGAKAPFHHVDVLVTSADDLAIVLLSLPVVPGGASQLHLAKAALLDDGQHAVEVLGQGIIEGSVKAKDLRDWPLVKRLQGRSSDQSSTGRFSLRWQGKRAGPGTSRGVPAVVGVSVSRTRYARLSQGGWRA